MNYLTINETAEKWNITPRRVQQLCKNGSIYGAIKEGRSWRIPADTILPLKNVRRTERNGFSLHYKTIINEVSPSGDAWAKASVNRAPLLPLPVGISSYIEAVTRYYYVEWPWPLKFPLKALPVLGDSLVGEPPPIGVQLLVESPVLFSQMSAVKFSVLPLNEVPVFTNCATPASCSGVEMS